MGKGRWKAEDASGRVFESADASLATERHKAGLRRMATVKAEVEAENREVRELTGLRVR